MESVLPPILGCGEAPVETKVLSMFTFPLETFVLSHTWGPSDALQDGCTRQQPKGSLSTAKYPWGGHEEMRMG